MNLENFYLKCPLPLQTILVNLQGWSIRRRRYNQNFFRTLKAVEEQGDLQLGRLQDFQAQRLRTFFRQARSVPYWAQLFNEREVDPDKEDIFAEYRKLPVLTKTEVKVDPSRFINPTIPPQELISCHTSGTTGSGLVFPVTREFEQTQWATWWRYRRWHGLDFKTWCGYFGGRSLVPLEQSLPPFWRINYSGRQVMFSAYHLSGKTAACYLDELRQKKVPWLHGYPSTLSLLAGFKHEISLDDLPALRVITTGAESLLPNQKKIMLQAFGVPVREHYGQAEGVANISECEEGHLHIDEDFSYVELCPVVGQRDTFRIVGTNWSNPAFPLIRYDSGDLVTLVAGGGSCGRAGRVVAQIDGRREDFVVLPSGAKVGRLDHIFKDLTKIREAQIYQPASGRLIFRIVKGQGYDRGVDEKKLLAEAHRRLGGDISIEIQYLDNLQKSETGKLRFVISDIPESKV